MMKIAVLRLGQVDPNVTSRIRENLNTVFADTAILQISETMPLPQEAHSRSRQQYQSETILSSIVDWARKHNSFDNALGILDVDIFARGLSFVFGEAEHSGKAALISLWRLKQEFYQKKPDEELLIERGTKEAVHELGHAFGLKHCVNPFCVMYFSNSIFETDRKQTLFCNKCYLKTMMITDKGRVVDRRV